MKGFSPALDELIDLSTNANSLIENLERKERDKHDDVILARVEQLYPTPQDKMMALTQKYPKAEVWWVQEESENMGAWYFIHARLHEKLHIRGIARKNSASPATGFKKVHLEEQETILQRAFA